MYMYISTAYRKSIFSVEPCSKASWTGSGSGLDELISSNYIISTAYRKSIFSSAQKSIFSCAQKLAGQEVGLV